MISLSGQPESHIVKQHTCTKMSNPRYNNEVRIHEIYSNDNYVIGWCMFDSRLHPPHGFVCSLTIAAVGPLPCC